MNNRYKLYRAVCCMALGLMLGFMTMTDAYAIPVPASIPGSADVSRVKAEEKQQAPDHAQDQEMSVPSAMPLSKVPEGAKNIHFILKEVRIEGVTVFTPDKLSDIYAPYIGKETTIEIAYIIAGLVTERYRSMGYFISLAYVPNQHIKDGIITIKVVEGYVAKVEMEDGLSKRYVVQSYIDRLLAQKPLKSDAIESFLLKLNDLPGYSFRSVLSPMKGSEDGAVKLTLIPDKKKGAGSVSFDNFSSRYLGVNELSGSYGTSLIPLQQTSVSGISNVYTPMGDKLKNGTLDHSIVIAPDLTLDLNAALSEAHPAFTLQPFDFASKSTSLATSLAYQVIRQREENLVLKLTLDGKNSNTDVFSITPFTRDRIRALRANATYDASDSWRGYNVVNLTVTHGLPILDSSKSGDPRISRAAANPDFSKGELSITRQQAMVGDWSLVAAASGQLASGQLYSTEEFGYGGQSFGRAFDSSEITGDQGLNGSLEFRYSKWSDLKPLSVQPYTFYDVGMVCVKDATRDCQVTKSVGVGVRGNTLKGLSLNMGLAYPLLREIQTPVYGQGSNGPRIILQISQGF